MGLHNLPANYDAWRTTPPSEYSAKPGYLPDTLTTPLCIEAGEITIDAMGDYDADTGELVSVQINGIDFAVHEVEAMLQKFAPRQTGHWDRDMSPDKLNDLLNEAAGDYECDRADYLRGLREDR